MFDSGCSNMVCKKSVADKLMSKNLATKIVDGPIKLNGVANKESICKYGKYSLKIPLKNGTNVSLSGICLDKITSTCTPCT